MEFAVLNVIVGTAVIVLNLIPLVTKKYKYLLITAMLSLIIMYLARLM